MKILSTFVSVSFGVLLLSCQHNEFLELHSTGVDGSSAITGRILDEWGKPIPGATISLSGPTLSGCRSTITDLEGYYYIPFLPSATDYKLVISAIGYAPAVHPDLVIPPFAILSYNFTCYEGNVDYYLRSTTSIDYHLIGMRISNPKNY